MLRNGFLGLLLAFVVIGFPSCGGSQNATGIQPLSCGGTVKWVQPLAGEGSARVRALAALPDGTFVAAGHFDGTLTLLDHRGELLTLRSQGEQDAYLGRFNALGLALWAVRMGGPGDDRALAITTLEDGTTVVAGAFGPSAVFGYGDKTQTLLATTKHMDGFIAWYTPTGQLERVVSMESPGDAEVGALASLPDGSVMVGGTQWREQRALLLPSKLPVLVRSLPFPVYAAEVGTAVERLPALREKGRDPIGVPPLIDARRTQDHVGFTPEPVSPHPETSPWDILGWVAQKPPGEGTPRVLLPTVVVARYTRAGERVPGPLFESTGGATFSALTRLGNGSLAVTGQFTGELLIGGADKGKYAAAHPVCDGCVPGLRDRLLDAADEGVLKLRSQGLEDLFLAKFDAAGRLSWAKRAGTAGERLRAAAVTSTDEGALWVGAVARSYPLRLDSVLDMAVPGQLDTLMLLHLEKSTGQLAIHRYAEASNLRLGALAPVPGGGLALLGSYQNTMSVLLGKSSVPVTSQGGEDLFIARLDAAGAPLWMHQVTGTGQQVGEALAVLPDGAMLLGGSFEGTTSFATTPNELVRSAKDASDAFILSLK